ncbi:hypothetical protein [Dyella sp. EPa41]|uniref:hypothetical protein n=1 Tax=Dyella sp. EPa41 TaxID=1561194 RepID=UPI0019160EA5|nr:hypothetical protein [Dyella sp. EPa41]
MRRSYLAVFTAAAMLAGMSTRAVDLKDIAEASMLVSGTIEVLPDGSVGSYALYKEEKLPAPVIDLIKRNVSTWKFQLKTPSTTPIKEDMSLRIIAKDEDAQHMTLRLAGANFSDGDSPESSSIRWQHRVSPLYPKFSLDHGMSGTVYILVRIGRDGKVINTGLEQVNLRRYVPDQKEMARFRKDLADAAIKVSRRWTFETPTSGEEMQAPFWDAQIPVDFNAERGNRSGESYGSWAIYLRGPQEQIGWRQDASLVSEAPDAVPDGSIHPVGAGARLLTPLAN